MLTLDRINAEIAEVVAHGTNRQDVEHLASLFICRAGLLGEPINVVSASRMTTVESKTDVIHSEGESPFMACVNGKCFTDILPVLDELLSVLQATNVRLYNGVMRKIEQL